MIVGIAKTLRLFDYLLNYWIQKSAQVSFITFNIESPEHWYLLNISTCWILFFGLLEQDASYFCFWNYSWTKKHSAGKSKIGNFSSRFSSIRLCNSATSYKTVLQYLKIYYGMWNISGKYNELFFFAIFILLIDSFNLHMYKLGPRGPTHYIFGD